MKVKVLLIAAAMLALAASGFAQGFTACIEEQDFILTTTCDGAEGIPVGTMVYIYHDENSNGPDAADALALLCEQPPMCPTGPAGTFNLNQFELNGYWNDVPGQFAQEQCFVSAGALPTVNRFYMAVYYPARDNASIVWHSDIFSPPVGASLIDVANWTCTVLETPCDPSADLMIDRSAWGDVEPDLSYCLTACDNDMTVRVCVGPLGVNDDRVPVASINYDCSCYGNPASGVVIGDWMWTEMNGNFYYCADVTAATAGCYNFVLEYILPVEMGTVTFTPSDAAMKLDFSTRSESGAARFELTRDGELVKVFEAANSATGAEYSYTDNGLDNGRTYSYELVLVNLDGTSDVKATASVTPDRELAIITEYALGQNFPNPFNPTTNIEFDLVESNPVTLTVYNAAGQVVATLVHGSTYEAGRHNVSFEAGNLTSGLYFYTVQIGDKFSATKKMLLVK